MAKREKSKTNPEAQAGVASAGPEAATGGNASAPAGPAGQSSTGKDTNASTAAAGHAAAGENAGSGSPAVLRITSKREGFRRAGVAHSKTPTDHPIDAFTPDQLAALFGESMLIVERIGDD